VARLRTPHPLLSALLVLAGASLFGTVGTAQALGPDVPPTSLAAARMLTTAACFVVIALVLGHGRRVAAALRHAPSWFAGAGQGAFNLFFLAAMKETGVAVGTLVAIGAAPVMTGLIARHVTRLWLLATAVAVAGLALLVWGQQGGAMEASPAGVLLALGAAASYATYIVAGNAAEARGLETQSFLAAAFSVSAALTLPWLVAGELGWVSSTGGALLLGYLVLVPTILAYSLFNRGLRGVRSSTASTLALIEPVVAAVLAFVLLDERLGPTGLAGAALILLGLLLIVRSTAAQSKEFGSA
jgi:DME family drug/metabolite transporter